MTDEQLLALVEQKAPEELTLEEIELLRSRLETSPAIREALAAQLEVDTKLSVVLARSTKLTPEQILARQPSLAQGNSRVVLIALLLVIPIVGLSGAILWNVIAPSIASVDSADDPAKETNESDADQPETADDKTAAAASSGDAENSASQPASGQPSGPTPPRAENAPGNPAPAATSEPVKPAPPPLPWQAVIDAQGPLPPLSEVAFRQFDTEKKLPLTADVRPWFAAVPGMNHRIADTNTQRGKCAQLEGIARLLSPWTNDSALRLSLENYNQLQIHCYSGSAGVTLYYYEDQSYKWAAYTHTRDGNKPRPKSQSFTLTSTDDERNRRSEIRHGGPIELRYRNGQIILSRGDVQLITAPLPTAPDDVYFDGRVAFHGIELVRTEGDPRPLHSAPVALAIEKPAELTWQFANPSKTPSQEDLEWAAKFMPQPVAGGGIRLSADNPERRLNYVALLPRPVLGEVVLQLADIGPGTGVFLGRADGKSHEVLRFLKNKRGDCPLVARLRGWETEWEADFYPYTERPLAATQTACFVKLNYGCGSVRWSLSADGKSWATVDVPHENQPGEVMSIGLEIPQKTPKTGITIQRIELREFTGLTQLAQADLLAKVPHVGDLTTYAQWQAALLASQPREVPLDAWRRTFAVATLAQGLTSKVSFPVLEGLLDDPLLATLPLEKQIAALSDAALMTSDFRNNQSMRRSVPQRFIDLAMREISRTGVQSFSEIRRASLSYSVNSWQQQEFDPSDLFRALLCHAVYEGNPADILMLSQQLRFYHTAERAPLLDWAESIALRSRVDASGEGLTRLKDGWRHPLIEQLSKDTYSRLTEIQSVIESEAWNDAARMITSIDPESAPGVAPYFGDRSLLASLPVAIDLMLADHPPLREALATQFAPLAKLRLAQATLSGNAPLVELAAVQFSGTDSAAEAHQWLGDRALASGWFERARLEYEQARARNPALAAELAPRIRLAAAMLGVEAEAPVTADVRFGDISMSASNYETMIREMIARGDRGLTAVAAPITDVPAPTSYTLKTQARLDGPAGERPNEEQGSRTNQNKVPWVDLQIEQVLDGNVLYVSNRFQLAAYDLSNNGTRLWQSQAPPGSMQAAQKLTGIPFRPVVTSDRIFIRMHYGDSPQLCCYEKSSGKLLWNTASPDRQRFISDPILLQGRLGVMGLSPLEQDEAVVTWQLVDWASGQIQSTHEIVRLRSIWLARQQCDVAADLDQAIASLGGIVVAFDPRGQVRWMRKQTTMPPEEDSSWVRQRFQPPLVVGDTAYIAQAGVRELLAVDRKTGRLRWSRVLPSLVGITGIAAGQLIAEESTGLTALDPATGRSVWTYDAPHMHPRVMLGAKLLLIATRYPLKENEKPRASRLIWIDAATGLPTQSAKLEGLDDDEPRIGLMQLRGDRIWLWSGKSQHDTTRDLVELTPSGPALPVVVLDPSTRAWQQRLAPELREATALLASPFQLLEAQAGDRTGLLAEAHGKSQVVALRGDTNNPILWSMPAAKLTGGKKLRLEAARDNGWEGKIILRCGDRVLQETVITDAAFPDRWVNLTADLSPAQVSTDWITLELLQTGGGASPWYFKTLAVE